MPFRRLLRFLPVAAVAVAGLYFVPTVHAGTSNVILNPTHAERLGD